MTVRFGTFDLDPSSGELRRAGLRVRLQRQPFKVLMALLERPGVAVSREDLRRTLWGDDTFVDFDHGLNFCVHQLRRALGDDALRPRFVETLPGVGYRFIAPVTRATPVEPSAIRPSARPSWPRWVVVLAALWLVGQKGGASAPRPIRHDPTPAVQAAYLKGLYHSARGTGEWPEAAQWLERAVTEDPGYAPAQSALAATYVRLVQARLRPARPTLLLARKAAASAMELDGTAAETHVWAGLAAMYGEWDWEQARREIDLALALDPGLAIAHRARAEYLSARGDDAGAVAAIDHARDIDPLCSTLSGEAGWYRYCARRYDEAEALWRAASAVRSDVELHESLLRVYGLQGRMEGAAQEALSAMAAAGVPAPTVAIVARRPPAEVMKLYLRGAIAHLSQPGGLVPLERLAALHASLGEHEKSLALLQRACAVRSPRIARGLRDPVFDALRSDERFQRLVQSVRSSS
jgi:DNA-binding winged helix-turn-helix (wHTH) protein/Tfp pilus assembly protein PilF